ncbi:hypothetical protein BJF78_01960 [Pseudonocardia sp. CNS-139]|nr:hypothetical protein BJF78_01960 [Pseudonocardia sp. CNS-139]
MPAVRRVRDVLRAEILAGRYAGGALPREDVLIRMFGVSRGVVRDVLALLREEGLVQRLQGAGTFAVTPARSAREIDALNARSPPPTTRGRSGRPCRSSRCRPRRTSPSGSGSPWASPSCTTSG